MSQEHTEQVYENYLSDHLDNDPKCLQHNVYFNTAYFMGKRGKEGLRELKKISFEIKINDNGREYRANLQSSIKKRTG